ncbi:putative ABC transporter phosphite binding protein PhnD1 [Paraburkholderia domus]|uniref:ABC transporter phosphite binding protein PhnD1 n=1 Tax=Paraburkholderia domus TaxID=2793075 RepID=A0A9N8MMI6_9BURK|nr:PhnD/SsuA/transferrin family substrate-binding protein [Paraburkholderia domus]MBK5060448.1 PhnD/SsuA/transferrin family substrate-binding protein [Burkholderia sp. R-70199]MBK5085472.1 PhnD/SsuA/transferrin family substrate-binding protein [Burkholderia sp. R-69927]MBK5164762.1 PhnD/SsuA/transferrin family substrate-binding protein [Burkholderia sp. R-70211]MBK5182605.1 PhnD/SsuA/transferrin family substrate-binding protein [Burkholderia sp. R-69749]MCI0150472.1 PhnD/SsuA/transferrin famil
MSPIRNIRRRQILRFALSVPLLSYFKVAVANENPAVAFGTTAVFLDNEISLLEQWSRELGDVCSADVRFVQRNSYREIDDLIADNRLDLAWVCGFPYVTHEETMRLMAIPDYLGQPLYHSYLIVPSSDAHTTHITQLRNRVFAFSDPGSNSGFLVPTTELIRAGIRPTRFFRKSFFTYAHRKVIDAVTSGLADAGEIDGYVYDTIQKQYPERTRDVRVAWRSPLYGFPPIVARRSLDEESFLRIQRALVGMKDQPAGRDVLQRLNLDGFVPDDDKVFDGIRRLVAILNAGPV